LSLDQLPEAVRQRVLGEYRSAEDGPGDQQRTQDLCRHGDSGRAVQRRFCPACGSPIFSEIEANPSKAGNLDDASGMRRQRHIFCASRRGWLVLPEDVPAFDQAAGSLSSAAADDALSCKYTPIH
jgi:hypothetical protein